MRQSSPTNNGRNKTMINIIKLFIQNPKKTFRKLLSSNFGEFQFFYIYQNTRFFYKKPMLDKKLLDN